MTGPDRVGATGDGEGPLVLVTEASFGAVRSLSTVRETLFVACMRWPTAHMSYTYLCVLVAFFSAVCCLRCSYKYSPILSIRVARVQYYLVNTNGRGFGSK